MSLSPPTPKQASLIWLALTGLALAVLVALIVGLVWGLGRALQILSPVLWPIAVAGVIAYLLDPVVDFFVRKRVPRSRAIIMVFGLALVILASLFGSVVPQLISEVRDLAEKIPAYTTRVRHRAEEWIKHPPTPLQKYFDRYLATPAAPTDLGTTNSDATVTSTNATGLAVANATAPSLLSKALNKDTLQSASAWLGKLLPRAGSWVSGGFSAMATLLGLLAGLALVPVYTFYFLLEKQGIESKWTDYLPVTKSEFKDELVFVLQSINNYLIVFFRGQVLVAVCDGVLYTIGFIIIGLPYSVLLGAMATVLTMIPFLGAMATCATALIIAFVQFGDWHHPLLVLAVFGVVQALEGLVISPKIMGDRVGLHPLTIIIAVMVGTSLLGGILGGLLAIPFTAALRVIMFRYVWKRRETENPA